MAIRFVSYPEDAIDFLFQAKIGTNTGTSSIFDATLMVTMLSHPLVVLSLEDLPNLLCALGAQIARTCPQKPLEHPDDTRCQDPARLYCTFGFHD